MGAMENWGLVTYRTTAVLFDEAKSDARYKNRIAYVVAHGTFRLYRYCMRIYANSNQNWHTNGLVTSLRWIGGTSSG